MKKTDINQLISQIEKTANKVDIIMRNRLVLAILLLVNGISFIVKPNSSIDSMTKGVAVFVILASLTLLTANITAKKKDTKTIILSAVTIAVCMLIYIFPGTISVYLKVILALIIIFDGLINVLDSLKLNSVSVYINHKRDAIKSIISKQEFNKDFEKGINKQTEKITSTIGNMIGKTVKYIWIYVAVNVISLVLGVLLLVKPDMTMRIWGIIFIYTGLSDFITAAKSMNLSKKIKEKDFTLILNHDEDA